MKRFGHKRREPMSGWFRDQLAQAGFTPELPTIIAEDWVYWRTEK